MKGLSGLIDYHSEMLEELERRIFHEDELQKDATSMTSKHYDSLVKSSVCTTEKKRESVIPQWLGLPVLPAEPYQDGKILSSGEVKLEDIIASYRRVIFLTTFSYHFT